MRVQAQLDGLTGKIRFEKRGRRESFGLDLMELTIDGLEKVCIVPHAHVSPHLLAVINSLLKSCFEHIQRRMCKETVFAPPLKSCENIIN